MPHFSCFDQQSASMILFLSLNDEELQVFEVIYEVEGELSEEGVFGVNGGE